MKALPKNWKKGKSAPKDGTKIIGWFGWPWPHVAMWQQLREEWAVVEVTVADTEIVAGKEVHEFGFEITSFPDADLLLWMPFPELPKAHDRWRKPKRLVEVFREEPCGQNTQSLLKNNVGSVFPLL